MARGTSRIILACALLIAAAPSLFGGENLKEERESLAGAWFFGAAFIPAAGIEGGRILDTSGKKSIEWWGKGISLESMYVSGPAWDDRGGSIFISLNTSIGFIQWNKQNYWMEGVGKIDSFTKDKGYSVTFFQKFRLNALLFKAFGAYLEGTIGGIYFHPENIEAGELVRKNVRFTGGGGVGFYLMVPRYNSLLFDFGVDLLPYKSFSNPPYKDIFFQARISLLYEFF